MTTKGINTVLLVLLVFLMGTIFIVRRDYLTTNVEFLPGMFSSVAYQPQSSNPNFPDRKTLQPPVKGTVVRGFQPFLYKATPEDALRAGEELHTPLEMQDSTVDLERGAFVYGNICKPCHGPGGLGDGVIPQHGYPPPPSLLAVNAMNMKDGQIFHIITYGQRNMPGLAGQVVRKDRWRVVKYIRSLQNKSKHVSVAAR